MCMMCMAMHAMDHSGHGASETASLNVQNESLLDILKRRYAMGEINRDQFEEMKSALDLGSSAQKPTERMHH